MNIGVAGLGYVGLVAGTCLADGGNDVLGMDIDADRVRRLSQGEMPIYEPGLKELLERGIREGRLRFTTNLEETVDFAAAIFIAVGTPEGEGGRADLRNLFAVAREIAKAARGPKVVIIKSTVPVGTGDEVEKIMRELSPHPMEVVSNPEFLKEGAAVEDFLKPDRVVIGTESAQAAELMRQIYAPFVRTERPILVVRRRSAEMVKYASNAFLATRISFINEIANLCDRMQADVDEVRRGMGFDRRIGHQFLFPGVGYGGSCFPKDMRAIIQFAQDIRMEMKILQAVEEVNRRQRDIILQKITGHFGPDLSGKTFAVWGIAFKPNTDDLREAPALTIINGLLQRGAKIKAYDPEAGTGARKIFGEKIEVTDGPYQAVQGSDALVLVTEWGEFRHPNFERIRKTLKSPVIFDGRNIYDAKILRELGFVYYGMGRS
ncbi:MAG: UDP-glucose/GDP-mannose dehydrogenase family protein [Proteobacteria bacterium]|nr:UDP-glucose/GDP-mannose dehydrogenase family protein [Pseudomonadota bacterium]